ncbi:protein aveugle [Drosophila sechellia]|uniref:GM21568 n=1 Tax=Drosophila sechellia TaxID=7238 RepID=B4HRN8_DROSE|nr:protein aveugle [Drosophila sechellia]EDW47902.1 GM21568 [Drosophila sechellia]
MGEETINSTQNKTRTKTTRPKAVYLWTVSDVLKWYRRHCSEYTQYEQLFAQHDITGRALLRITDSSLQRMGVTDNRDREAIWREIVKQRLKTDIMEIRDMERLNIY